MATSLARTRGKMVRKLTELQGKIASTTGKEKQSWKREFKNARDYLNEIEKLSK